MRRTFNIPLTVTALTIALGLAAQVATGSVLASKPRGEICVTSSGVPDHAAGADPVSAHCHDAPEVIPIR